MVDRFFPTSILSVELVDIGGLLILLFLIACLLLRARWWNVRALTAEFKNDVGALELGSRARVVSRVIFKDALAVEPLFHHYKKRWLLHLLVFYGFIGLMVTTTLDAIINRDALPLPISDPVKIIGNASGLILLLGATPMFFSLKKGNPDEIPLHFSDRVFLPVLYAATLTGFIIELFDYLGVAVYPSIFYVIHIAIVVALLVSAPWTRFVHALQAPYLTLQERFRQRIAGRTGDATDYKRLRLAIYARDNFFSEYALAKKEGGSGPEH